MYFDVEVPPLTVDALDREQSEVHIAALQEALTTVAEAGEGVTIRIARSYDRKGFETFDSVPGVRNPAYGADQDDYVVSLAFRVGCHRPSLFHKLEDIDRAVSGDKAAVELAKVELEVAQAEAHLARLAAKRATLQSSLQD